MIILLHAGIGEGKDTFCNLFAEHSKEVFHNIKFADPLKEMVATMTGCKREDLEDEDFKNSYLPEMWTKEDGSRYTYREVLQYVGTDLFREQFHRNTWVNASVSRLQEGENYIYTDHRFYSEREGLLHLVRPVLYVRIHRFMTRKAWLESKYFEGLHPMQVAELVDGVTPDIYRTESISKAAMINEIAESISKVPQEWYNDVITNRTYKKLTHQSEIELANAPFHVEINNDSTLEAFEEKIRNFIEELTNK